MMQRRQWWLAALIALVAIVVGVSTAVWLHPGKSRGVTAGASASLGVDPTSPSFPTPSPVTTVSAAVPFTDADADRISTALSSGDPATTAQVLVPEFREDFLRSGVQALPVGSTVTLLTDRFVAVRPDYGSVPLIVEGSRDGRFVAVLLYEEGQWLVMATQEVA